MSGDEFYPAPPPTYADTLPVDDFAEEEAVRRERAQSHVERRRLRAQRGLREWVDGFDWTEPAPPEVAQAAKDTFSQALDAPAARTEGFDPADFADTEYDRECARERMEHR